jgi:single-stranded-DNA-specific exonuclease
VLAGRGVALEDAENFLNPTLRGLMPQPASFRDMEPGAQRIADAIVQGESIGIIGDYDVDGVCASATMLMFLRAVGSGATVYLPDRVTEGYGPSRKAVETHRAAGAKLLLTLDCGVMAHDPLAHAASLGLETVIVDHHQASADLPQAHAVINPNRQDDLSGCGYLCAAGVTMILIAAINKNLRVRGHYRDGRPEPNVLQWLELTALATVCDVVPLQGLNRAYVTQGLKVMARRENLGLAALCDVARLKQRPDTYALGFMLGPRLNAAGRVGHADLALNLLLAKDRGEAANIAQKLDQLNRERQTVEMRIVDRALAQAEAMLGQSGNLPVLLVTGENWHPGVLGLAAARLKERFKLPSFVLSQNGQGFSSGSGRSVAGVDLGAAVREAVNSGIVMKGGGHAMAAGLTVEATKLGELRAFLETRLAASVAASPRNELQVDGALAASGATPDLIELLEQAGPYGSGHPAPVFVLPAHNVIYADPAGADHIRCTIASKDGARIKAIAFRAMGTDWGEALLTERKFPLHIAGRLSLDTWGNKSQPQLQIEDVARVQ